MAAIPALAVCGHVDGMVRGYQVLHTDDLPHWPGASFDPDAVLDARLRVRGTDNLMVSDMSAVPDIVAGNTNATAMMLGDRCADFVLSRLS